jgi:predicted pyridoxine 5'-phosphate oxidase superfamily flavin-nucleotide-binding protein
MSKVLGDKLTPDVMALINDKKTVAVLATVSPDGYPNTAPMHLIVAPDDKNLLLAIGSMHCSYNNIKENGKVMLSILDDQDTALSIKGNAKVIKEAMDGHKSMAMVKVEVLEIKGDTTPTLIVTSGVKTAVRSKKTPEFFRAMFNELIKFSDGGIL